jgi:hypothetical protein
MKLPARLLTTAPGLVVVPAPATAGPAIIDSHEGDQTRAQVWRRHVERGPVPARPLPSIGSRIHLEFPKVQGRLDSAGRYLVVDVDGADGVTARPLRGDPPEIRAGTPCLVDYTKGARRLNIDAIALSSGAGGVILQLHTADQRRSPRSGQPMTVTIEVPGTGLGVIEGIAEDISLGGLRLRVPAHLPAGRRAFVSVTVADREPILAAARILTCERTVDGLSHFARVEFTLVSAHDQARLFALMDWPATASSATGSEWQISVFRHRVRIVSSPPRPSVNN